MHVIAYEMQHKFYFMAPLPYCYIHHETRVMIVINFSHEMQTLFKINACTQIKQKGFSLMYFVTFVFVWLSHFLLTPP